MRILFVDRHNDCLSASAEVLTRGIVTQWGLNDVQVFSAGLEVGPGAVRCAHSPTLARVAHTPRQLTVPLLEGATFILTARRSHQPDISAMTPLVRSKMFTIRQAGRFASWLLAEGILDVAVARAAGMSVTGATYGMALKAAVQPLPQTQQQRDQWLAMELDSCRGALDNRPSTGKKGRSVTFDLPNPDRTSRLSHTDVEALTLAEVQPLLRLIWAVRAA